MLNASHDTAQTPRTAGRVIRRARWYDLLGKIPFLRALRETLIELAAPASGEHVLDVGCGTGTLAIALASRAGPGKVHGIDASPEMIEVAREKAAKAGVDVDFQLALIEALPFPDASFDLVTCSLVLHHLPEALQRTGLAQVRRVLRPGGRLLVVDFVAPSHSPLGHLLALLGHARGPRTVDTLTPMLAEAGFSDVEPLSTRHKRFAFVRAR